MVSLLERFRDNPEETRDEMRMELGWFDEAAEMFALVVFLCDGLLEIKEKNRTGGRFFKIAEQLPMELQMVLCHRVVGSMDDNISQEASEAAFRALARQLV